MPGEYVANEHDSALLTTGLFPEIVMSSESEKFFGNLPTILDTVWLSNERNTVDMIQNHKSI